MISSHVDTVVLALLYEVTFTFIGQFYRDLYVNSRVYKFALKICKSCEDLALDIHILKGPTALTECGTQCSPLAISTTA